MPELVWGGPDIPVALMNRRDDGKVVFFCGAGISVSTGLPTFQGLVTSVYETTGQVPNDLEQHLLKRSQLDKVIGLLEARLNPGGLRKEVIDRLSAPPTGSLDTHIALVDLSRVGDQGVRIVTTNFDDRFEQAAPDLIIDSAPKLPIPKPHGWASLVHLHGRIRPNDEGDDLVLTAADFGRAYLTERWASRFITELFREFTIVFVGYSLDDPVLSYMVDALAAERSRGARFQEAYAFAGHESGNEKRKKAELAWRAKSVTPIPFDSGNEFKRLNDTLVEWARISKDPVGVRQQIVAQGLRVLPANARDITAERVVWALFDRTAAEALARTPPVSDERDYQTMATWLDILDEAGLFSRPSERFPDGSQRRIHIADNAFSSYANQSLDHVTEQLALWISRNIHVPQVLGWAVRKGGHLHPQFRDMVRRRLAGRGGETIPAIPSRLRLLWTILLQSEPEDPDEDLWWAQLIANATDPLERRLVEQALIASLRPRLVLRPGPSSELRFRYFSAEKALQLTPLEECAHTALIVGRGRRDFNLEGASFGENMLADHAFSITKHLLEIDDLIIFDEDDFKNPMFYRPSIADHDQNRTRDDWTFLIDWARDGYFALAKEDRQRADLLLDWWIRSAKSLLHRLALHALTEDRDADITKSKEIILAGESSHIWSGELHHEIMVFLRRAAQRLPSAILSELIETIKAGPSTESVTEEERRRRAWQIGMRLRKLEVAGITLDPECQALADASRPANEEDLEHEEFLSWIGEARWVASHDHVRSGWKKPPLEDLIAEAKGSRIDEEEFEGVCYAWPCRAFLTLRALSKSGHWPSQYWRRLLWATHGLRRGGKIRSRLDGHIVSILSGAPAELFVNAGSEVSIYLEDYSKTCLIEQEAMFAQLWRKAWDCAWDGTDVAGEDDVLNQALNSTAGRLAESALNRLWKYAPQAEKGLPEPVVVYFDAIAAADAGSLGRIMLAAQLANLFTIDSTWTTRSLLPRMRWDQSKEARDLWAAYAWAARAGPNLLAAIRSDFLVALQRYAELGWQRSNLIYLFVTASVDPQSVFAPEEILQTMGSLPEEALVDVANYFGEYIGDIDEERAGRWRDRCQPWLRRYWPAAASHNTTRTSIALVGCVIKTGEAFPEAVAWAREFLRPGTDHVLWRVQKSEVHRRWPADALTMLAIMIPDNNLPNWNRGPLREMLDQMRAADESVAQNAQYQRLYRL